MRDSKAALLDIHMVLIHSVIALFFSSGKSLLTWSYNQRKDFNLSLSRKSSSASCITTFIKQGHFAVNTEGASTKIFFSEFQHPSA